MLCFLTCRCSAPCVNMLLSDSKAAAMVGRTTTEDWAQGGCVLVQSIAIACATVAGHRPVWHRHAAASAAAAAAASSPTPSS